MIHMQSKGELPDMNKLSVYSIFKSIDGECNDYGQGALTIFIRLAGCNLRCQYPCDTPNSLSVFSGKPMSIDEIIDQVRQLRIKKVTITGGEPLTQLSQLARLCNQLSIMGYLISIETNGSISPEPIMKSCNVNFIMDYKLPSSGEEEKMAFSNFEILQETDFVKFVILDGYDFERAVQVRQLLIDAGCQAKFTFSPVHGRLEPKKLIQWLYEAMVPMAIINVQLHKILDLSEPK